MAHIVQFRSGAARAEPENEADGQGGAQIIIFPGVRRERHGETAVKSRRRDKARPTRDRLELPD